MSEYDHVGMVLRYSNGKIVILESTGQTVTSYFLMCIGSGSFRLGHFHEE